jgi:hypothetical protein
VCLDADFSYSTPYQFEKEEYIVSQPENAGNCERCQQDLHGHLGVFESELFGVAVVAIKETSPRNWICCDACSVLLCHSCCQNPQSGYCDTCFAAIANEEKERYPYDH